MFSFVPMDISLALHTGYNWMNATFAFWIRAFTLSFIMYVIKHKNCVVLLWNIESNLMNLEFLLFLPENV
jgi:hypothetical protein